MSTIKLKYLFLAEYTDGTIQMQPHDDKSLLDPEKRSSFYDVLQSGKKIKKFSLIEDKLLGGNKITVDLETGYFEVNGLSVLVESDKLPTTPDKFDLIFYRQHTHDFNAKYNSSGNMEMPQEISHTIEYFLGWQCNIKGKNYQAKIAVI